MDNIVNLKELRQNVAKYIKQVEKGETFVVVKRSKPVFRMVPIDEEGWETVVDFTQFKRGGLSASQLLEKLEDV